MDDIKNQKQQEKEKEEEKEEVKTSKLIGIDIDGKGNINCFDINPKNKTSSLITVLKGTQVYALGELSFNAKKQLIATANTTSTIVYDLKNKAELATFEQLNMIEFNETGTEIYGLNTKNNTTNLYIYNLESKQLRKSIEIPNVKYFRAGSSSISYKSGLYLFNSTLGLEVIDIKNEKWLERIDGIVEAEYNSNNDKIVGLSSSKNGVLVEYDLDNKKLSTIGSLEKFKAYNQGHCSFDPKNDHYIIRGVDGFTFYNINTLTAYWPTENSSIDFIEQDANGR